MGAPRTLLIRTVAGRRIEVEVSEHDSVDRLQDVLAREYGCPLDLQVLLLSEREDVGNQLCPGKMLSDYAIGPDEQVILIRNLPEMPMCKPQVSPAMEEYWRWAKSSSRPCSDKLQKGGEKRSRQAQRKVAVRPMPPRPAFPPPPFPPPAPPRQADDCSGLSKAVASALAAEFTPDVEAQRRANAAGGNTTMPASAVATGTSAPLATGPPPTESPVLLPKEGPQSRQGSGVGTSTPVQPNVRASGSASTPAKAKPAPSSMAPSTLGVATESIPTLPTPSSGRSVQKLTGSGTVGQSPRGRRIRRADLDRVGRLGVGAFGVVTLEADRRTGRTYALKAVSKGYLQSLNMEYSVLNEKKILKLVDSPFVVRLLATYNGKEHVYFLLEAALGGELFTTYERLRLYGQEKHAQFYVACVVEALAHLHERQVIYRDLKPENLLLDARGYCKLTDMGLAKVSAGLTFTLVGTPDYMAPEVIKCSGHGRSVDWWMLGVLLFELMCGKAPFEAPKTELIYELVKRGIEHVQFPDTCRGPAADLVRALCKQNPDSRLRVPALRDHAWFKSLEWDKLRTLRLTPPFPPRVRGARDLANFRQCDQEDPPAIPYKDNGSGWDIGFEDDCCSHEMLVGAVTPSTASGHGVQRSGSSSRLAQGGHKSSSQRSEASTKASSSSGSSVATAVGNTLSSLFCRQAQMVEANA
eukprot:TRINITY_DN5030_c0_g2_i2.p1 TRINITY_DN5030_c0_g2~~TRINITY_DN5030_c0_g2_i2.p1  ORF type:complete len:695 (+),score=124.50 TRINITY_DN5030_c0_g2_i2:217-2301(+)